MRPELSKLIRSYIFDGNLVLIGKNDGWNETLLELLRDDHGEHHGVKVDPRMVRCAFSLEDAKTHLKESTRLTVVIFDPRIASVSEVLTFLKAHQRRDIDLAKRRLIWVVFASKEWWHDTEPLLRSKAAIRIKDYFRIESEPRGDLIETRALVRTTAENVILNCCYDLLQLFVADAAESIARQPTGLTLPQKKKWAEKNVHLAKRLFDATKRTAVKHGGRRG